MTESDCDRLADAIVRYLAHVTEPSSTPLAVYVHPKTDGVAFVCGKPTSTAPADIPQQSGMQLIGRYHRGGTDRDKVLADLHHHGHGTVAASVAA